MSPTDLVSELRAARPAAPGDLRLRVAAIAAAAPSRRPARSWSLRLPRLALVAVPAAAALALVSAGAIGLSRSDGGDVAVESSPPALESSAAKAGAAGTAPDAYRSTPAPAAIAPSSDRAQRFEASLALEVEDADAVSKATQDALQITRSLGGYVVSVTTQTGEGGTSQMTLRVPTDRVQDAIVRLSALGTITSQQVSIQDLQEPIDGLEAQVASLQAQLAAINRRLQRTDLTAEQRAALEARRARTQSRLSELRQSLAVTRREARWATVQLAVTAPAEQAAPPPASRIDRALDEALNVLAWEGVGAAAAAIVLAPFALALGIAWLLRRSRRRRDEERLLAAP